jgi:hypothetical protein
MHQIHTKHAQISEKVLHTPSNETLASLKKIHTSKKKQTDLVPTTQDPQRDPTNWKLKAKIHQRRSSVSRVGPGQRSSVGRGWRPSGWSVVMYGGCRGDGGRGRRSSGRRWSRTAVIGETWSWTAVIEVTVVWDGGLGEEWRRLVRIWDNFAR